MLRLSISICIVSFIVSSCGREVQPNSVPSSHKHLVLSQWVDSLQINTKDLSLYVDKSDYILQVKHKDTVVKSYAIVLGGNPIDDKRREGDQCTPEGIFKVQDLYPHQSWKYFIWIDYPTQDSWKKHKEAKAHGEIPENSTIGGEVGIHGVPEGRDDLIENSTNWTLGCVSLSNSDITELYKIAYKGMKVEIVP